MTTTTEQPHSGHHKKLIIVLGPTGVGKTDLTIQLAKDLGTEIISADSRQIYKELYVGTAVPTPEQLQAVPHHFIQNKSIHDYYNASMYEFEVMDLLETLFAKHDTVLMTGGSMMYIDALCKGIDDLPTIRPEIRQKFMDEWHTHGIEHLQKKLAAIDPEYYALADTQNPKRLLKALEVFEMTGQKYSSFRTGTVKERPFDIVKIGLNRNRDELYTRINLRVDEMLRNGLEAEARPLLPYRHLNSLNTVGYKELFDYFEEKISRDEAIELIKRDSRRYARRQLSWFRRDAEIAWFHPQQYQEVAASISARKAH